VVPREHSGKNILWVGRFEQEKDPLLAIDVFKEVLREVPDARLTMVGDGSLRDAVAKHAANLPVDSWKLTGWSKPIRHFDTADAVLSTSPAESYGAVLVEALAASVSVVSLDVGVAREAGATIAPSRAALAETLVRMLKDGKRGHLNPAFTITKEEWMRRFRNSLA
jgi:glycosyltransferase involved in cell wall biosynthesis